MPFRFRHLVTNQYLSRDQHSPVVLKLLDKPGKPFAMCLCKERDVPHTIFIAEASHKARAKKHICVGNGMYIRAHECINEPDGQGWLNQGPLFTGIQETACAGTRVHAARCVVVVVVVRGVASRPTGARRRLGRSDHSN